MREREGMRMGKNDIDRDNLHLIVIDHRQISDTIRIPLDESNDHMPKRMTERSYIDVGSSPVHPVISGGIPYVEAGKHDAGPSQAEFGRIETDPRGNRTHPILT